MFRAAQANPFDDAVGKATDENLTSENWEYILDVCDKVEASDTGGKDAVAALIKRLAHRNANVQLYTLELANALSQNCGVKIHKELASRSFTDAMLRLAGDRNTHQQVKTKILERMEEWTEMFSKDPDLGIMEQAFGRLRSQNPNLQPPSKPFKREITDVDRQKEEDELQMALALSIKDKPTQTEARKQSQTGTSREDVDIQSPGAGPSGQGPHSMPSGTTAATVSRVRALYDFVPSEAGELAFRKGDIIAVLESVYKDWWKGSLRGQTGIFPLNYVEKLQDPTQEELARDAEMESEVFGEIKNVERLLALLSTSTSEANVRENDEISSLYNQTVAIRPKLIELISKYSQKKDDFTQLNEKFIKARRDYESLLDASMSHAAQNPYARPPPSNYGYAPPPSQSQPPPPQQQQQPADPSSYYSAPPPQHQHQPQHHQHQPSDPSGAYPPRTGPAPFYMIPPGQGQVQGQAGAGAPPPLHAPQQPSQAPPSAPPPGPPEQRMSPAPSNFARPPPAAYVPPEQRTSVQELASSNYDPTSPLEDPGNGNPYGPPPTGSQGLHQQHTSAPSVGGGVPLPYPPADGPTSGGGGGGGGYAHAPAPLAVQHSGTAAGAYSAYQPLHHQQQQQQQQGGQQGDVSDYYR